MSRINPYKYIKLNESNNFLIEMENYNDVSKDVAKKDTDAHYESKLNMSKSYRKKKVEAFQADKEAKTIKDTAKKQGIKVDDKKASESFNLFTTQSFI